MDGAREVAHLRGAVAHRGDLELEVREFAVRRAQRADEVLARIDDLAAVLAHGQGAGAELHAAVGEGRSVADHEASPTLDQLGMVDDQLRSALLDHGAAVVRAHRGLHLRDVLGRGAVDLVDHDDVGEQQVDEARVIGRLVAGAVWIDDRDEQIGGTSDRSLLPPSKTITSASRSAARRICT